MNVRHWFHYYITTLLQRPSENVLFKVSQTLELVMLLYRKFVVNL